MFGRTTRSNGHSYNFLFCINFFPKSLGILDNNNNNNNNNRNFNTKNLTETVTMARITINKSINRKQGLGAWEEGRSRTPAQRPRLTVARE